MRRMQFASARSGLIPMFIAVIAGLIIGGCRNEATVDPVAASMSLAKAGTATSLSMKTPGGQELLVADNSSFGAMRVDAELLNAWGLALSPNGIVWISANHSGRSVVYDQMGATVRPPVLLPSATSDSGGSPTGVIFNSTNAFLIPANNQPARFIFASEDGIISAWNTGNNSHSVVDRSGAGAVYKGIEMAQAGSSWFIYATNFKGNAIDVFDQEWKRDTTKILRDPAMPAGFAPFNIRNIDGYLFVTYALQKGPDNQDDQSGPGNGYIDVYTPDGQLVRRFASQGSLNSPWGIAVLPRKGHDDDDGRLILVGNFGDGKISLFRKDGTYAGQLKDSTGMALTIPGLWALEFGTPTVMADTVHAKDEDDNGQMKADSVTVQRLLFTAGPNSENDGLFGAMNFVKHRGNGGHGNEGDDHEGHHGSDGQGHGGEGHQGQQGSGGNEGGNHGGENESGHGD